MRTAMLFPLVTLGAFTLSPALTRADADQRNTPVAIAVAPAVVPGCLSATGSRLPQKDTRCAAFGHSYTEQDLRRTGMTSVGDALSRLDPAITVRR
jgi:hypothetical protein